MNNKFWKFELIAYIFIFFIAIFFRLPNLGQLPLSDVEAKLALDAISLNSSGIGGTPLQVLLANITALIFYVFGASNILARIIPALTGCVLVITPLFFRRYFNRNFLLLISFWMAIDPGFVALSRQINSSIIVILLFLLTLFSLLNKKYISVGIFIGLLILCGTSFWFGVIPIILTIVIIKFSKSPVFNSILDINQDIPWKKLLFSFGITIIVGGTAGFIYPGQFGNILNGLMGYFNGWIGAGQITFWYLFRTMYIYNLPLFLFGIIGLTWLTRNYPGKGYFLVLWTFLNFVQILLYPHRSVELLIWVMVPLLISGSIFISSHISLTDVNKKTIITVVGAGLVFLGFMTLISLKIGSTAWQQTINNSWSVLLVAFGVILIMLAMFLIGWTISWKTAGKSFLILVTIYLGFYSISASWNAAGLRKPYQNEMWWLDRLPLENDLLTNTINDYSEWNGGFTKNAEIKVVNLDIPSIRWALRDYKNIQYVDVLPNSSNPQMIIGNIDEQIAMIDSYRGQDFTWTTEPVWSFLLNTDWESWILSRRIPIDKQASTKIVLWIRNDLFPGSKN